MHARTTWLVLSLSAALAAPAAAQGTPGTEPGTFIGPFALPTPSPFNQDEENSGIIEVTDIVRSANSYEKGRRYFLADTQAHYPIPGELFEGGQLYLIASPKP